MKSYLLSGLQEIKVPNQKTKIYSATNETEELTQAQEYLT